MNLSFWVLSASCSLVVASPIPENQTNGSESMYLPVILTVFSILSLLVALKRLYINRRRAEIQNPTGSLSSCNQSSTSFLPSIHGSIAQSAAKNAFLVGFFGSPSWESKLKFCHDQTWGHNSSYSSHTASRRSGFNEKHSITEFGGSEAVTIQAKTYPIAKLRRKTSNNIERRLSLPISSRKSTFEHRRKRHSSSSLKSTSSTRHSETGLRMVSSSNDHPFIPESPKQDEPLSSQFPFPPSSPPFYSSSAEPVDSHSYISHPYALAPRRKRSVKSHTPQFRPLSHAQALEAAVEYIRSSPPLSDENPAFSPTLAEQFKDYTALSITPVSPLSPIQPPFPSPPPPAATFPHIKPRVQKVSLGVRKSPPVGPSPLRIMTLPESFVSDSSKPQTPEKYDPQSKASRRHHYPDLGLGYPTSAMRTDIPPTCVSPDALQSSGQFSSRNSSRRLSKIEEDPTTLIGIIRELVEETSGWDTSLFVDDNFRSLIEASSQSRVNFDLVPMHQSRVEADLGLCELDVIRMGHVGGESDGRASYQHSGYTFVQKPETIGLAW
ncbi:hypothetical protein C8J56DRAFT_1135262 [Mycena floridula]|nr:hypothetical protein C8J56DRAFT_1135262 [Mycena floridula]